MLLITIRPLKCILVVIIHKFWYCGVSLVVPAAYLLSISVDEMSSHNSQFYTRRILISDAESNKKITNYFKEDLKCPSISNHIVPVHVESVSKVFTLLTPSVSTPPTTEQVEKDHTDNE